jgi:hypothetical protein
MEKLFLRHFFLWISISIGYVVLIDVVVKKLFIGFHDILIWFALKYGGLALIIIIMTIRLIKNIIQYKRGRNASR